MNNIMKQIEEESKALAKEIAVLDHKDKFSSESDMQVAEYCIYKAVRIEKMASRWRKVSEELPSYDDGLVVVKVRNKNKEDGIFLYDICYIDEETHTWSERYHTWEDIIEWKPII